MQITDGILWEMLVAKSPVSRIDVTVPPDGSGLLPVFNDDTPTGARVQAAADYLAASGGGVLYFPAGTYLMDRNSTLPSIPSGVGIAQHYSVMITGSNVMIEGDGAASVIKQADAFTTPFYFAFANTPGNGNIGIRRMKFLGDTTTTLLPVSAELLATSGGSGTGALLAFTGTQGNPARNFLISECLFEDGNKASPISLAYLENVSIVASSFVHFRDYFQLTTVRAASTGNIPSIASASFDPATAAVDGVTSLSAGDRLLVRVQTTGSENGVYVVTGTSSPFLLVRAEDADSTLKLEGLLVLVMEGTNHRGKVFRTFTQTPLVAGVSPVRLKNPRRVRAASVVAMSVPIDTGLSNVNVNGIAAGDKDQVFLGKDSAGNSAAYTAGPTPAAAGIYTVSAGTWQIIPEADTDDKRDSLVAVASDGSLGNLAGSNAGKTFFLKDSVSADEFKEFALPFVPVVYSSVVAASSAHVPNRTLSTGILDGLTLTSGDRVLLKDQDSTHRHENGVYVYINSSSVMSRASDARIESDFRNLRVVVLGYSTNNIQNGRRCFRAKLGNGAFTIDLSPIAFEGCDSILLTAKAATTAPLPPPLSGGPLAIDGVPLGVGDRVLVKDQANPVQNGIYIIPTSGTWVRASDMAANQYFSNLLVQIGNPTGTLPSNGGKVFGVSIAPGTPVQVNTTSLPFEEQIPVGRPSIFSGSQRIGSIRLENNHFDGDYKWSGPAKGCNGLLLAWQAEQVVAQGNTLTNFKTAAFQPNAKQTLVAGNTLRTTKRVGGAAVSLNPSSTFALNYTVEVTGNNCDGAQLVDTSTLLGGFSIDYLISGNTAILGPAPAAGGIRVFRGRRVSVQNNVIDQPSGFGIRATSDGSPGAVINLSGNTIRGVLVVSGLSNSAIDFNDQANVDGFFSQVVISNNLLGTATTGGLHVVARRPNAQDPQLHLYGNSFLDENSVVILPRIDLSVVEWDLPPNGIYSEVTGVVLSSLLDIDNTDYGVNGFYGREFWNAAAPTTDPAKYSQGDVVWNTSRTTLKSPLGFFHITAGKLSPVFGSSMGFSASAIINTNTSITPVSLLTGLSGQRFRVLEVSFVLQASVDASATGSLILKSTNGTPRRIASVTAAQLVANGSTPRVADGNVLYPGFTGGGIIGLGDLHDAGQGMEVIGSTDPFGITITPGNLVTSNPSADIFVYLVGVIES